MMDYISEEGFVKQAAPLYKSIYKRNSGGCCLHVIIDDCNWDCSMDVDELKHKDCRKLYELIQCLDLDVRWRIEYDVKTGILEIGPDEDECCPECGRPRR
jgi:hypothetical protein